MALNYYLTSTYLYAYLAKSPAAVKYEFGKQIIILVLKNLWKTLRVDAFGKFAIVVCICLDFWTILNYFASGMFVK